MDSTLLGKALSSKPGCVSFRSFVESKVNRHSSIFVEIETDRVILTPSTQQPLATRCTCGAWLRVMMNGIRSGK
jgi:hypothetical protein